MTRSARRSAVAESVSAAPGGDASASAGVTVEEIDGYFLLRPADERPEEQIELIGALAPAEGVAVVVVAVPDDRAEAMWSRLAEVLIRVRRKTRMVVLAMSDAGRGRTGEAALARRIADAWELTVVAPAGDVLLVPGGSLFVHGAESEPEPQWWSFAPNAEPTALGPRWPAPEWRRALMHVAASPDGLVVTAVPAGMLVQRVETRRPTPGDLAYAIPAAGDRPTVIVDAKVAAIDLAAVLSGPVARPEWRRNPLRLVPANGGDLLPLGQAVARELGIDVEVLTGPPVDPAETPHSPGEWRVVLLDDAGRPTWRPFVSSVLCRPPGRDGITPPRPVAWHPPMAGMRVADASRGVLRLGGTWRVAVTRAGLWVYPADVDSGFPDRVTAAWPVTADTIRVDVGTGDRTLDDHMWPLLNELLAGLVPGRRARLHLALHGGTTVEGDQEVRKLTARHRPVVEQVLAPQPAEEAVPVRTVLTTPAASMPAASMPAAAEQPSLPVVPEQDAFEQDAFEQDVLEQDAFEQDMLEQDVPSPLPAAVTAVTITPGKRSTDEERAAFRAMVGLDLDSHAAPIRRAFSRLAAIAATERAAAAVDLVAVRLYLTSPPDGAFGPAAIRDGGEALRPYLACLASGLGRLPTHRGVVLHGVDAPVRADLTGTVLTEHGPVGGLSLAGDGAYGWPPTATTYVIWSHTARRVAALFDDADGEETGRSGSATKHGDVVFAPGSRFAVLDVRPGDAETPDLVLLRELAATAFPAGEGADGETSQGGRRELTRLEEALKSTPPEAATASAAWPAHCLGPIGEPGPPPASAQGQAAGA
jgi:hypothetical protein